MRLIAIDKLEDYTWVEWPGDWAALYLMGVLVWQGHPGDFEWAYHLGMNWKEGRDEDLVGGRRHAPVEQP